MRSVTGLVFFLFAFSTSSALAQNLEGKITNTQEEVLPFTNIYIKEIQTGTASDKDGRYFLVLDPGSYQVVFSALGYHARTISVVVGDDVTELNVKLRLSDIKLDEVVVKAKKKDAAYEIIQKVISNRKRFLKSLASSQSEIYVRAMEVIEKKKRRKSTPIASIDDAPFDPEKDPFESKEKDTLENINLCELLVTLNFQAPDKFKEIRSGYKIYGSSTGLFLPQFSRNDFNFYRNIVDLKGIADVPLISPFSSTAILTYKYKLMSSDIESGVIVHKIKVTPRKYGNASCSGFVFINEGTWNINRVDISLASGSLKFHDDFRLKQDYTQVQDSFWLIKRQEFIYAAKQGKRKSFNGNTLLTYKSIIPNKIFPPKYFNNEISLTTKEALDRDSVYWQTQRSEPLTRKQQEVIYFRDSIDLLHKSAAYLDSTQKAYNKVTAGEVLWHGLGFRQNAKKSHIYFNSLLDLIGFEVIGGLRLGPYSNYFRRFENGKTVQTWGSASIGIKNTDLQGNFHFRTRYNPHRLADFGIGLGRSFESINNFDAYLNQLKRSNYILHDFIRADHRFEILNGLYLNTEIDFSTRSSLEGYESTTFLNELINDEAPLDFTSYQALITSMRITYTPQQKYITEPNRKVVIGSNFPTFSLLYKKGWNSILGSDINWDYLEFGLGQELTIGALGNSKYTLRVGQFTNTKSVPFVDLLRFRQSDPYLYSAPLHSFQLLDTSLSTTGLYLEAHYIHHFNGALINNIPLIKKLKFRVAAGAGALYVKENDYRHQEIFAGIERIFKIGARRRLRIGLFGVAADSNRTKASTGFKISFDIIDTWKKDWSH